MKLDERRVKKRVILERSDRIHAFTSHPEFSSKHRVDSTSLRGRSEPATSEAWWWQSREGLN